MDMEELLPDNMDVERRRATGEGELSQSRRPNILSWLQCFSLYAAELAAVFLPICSSSGSTLPR